MAPNTKETIAPEVTSLMPVTASQMTTKAAIKLNNRINSAGICSPGRTKLSVVLFMIFFAMRRFFVPVQ